MSAFEITAIDVENVLNRNRIANTEEDCEEIFDDLDCDRVEDAALKSGTDMNDQIEGALDEIWQILKEEKIVVMVY